MKSKLTKAIQIMSWVWFGYFVIKFTLNFGINLYEAAKAGGTFIDFIGYPGSVPDLLCIFTWLFVSMVLINVESIELHFKDKDKKDKGE